MTNSKTTDKLELLANVAKEFIKSGTMSECSSVEVKITWKYLCDGEFTSFVPDILIKIEK